MKDSILILSGGMDSVTMLYQFKEKIALALTFDYGSNHNHKEIPFAIYHWKLLGIEQITIPLSFIHDYFKSSLLAGSAAIPEGHYQAENMKSTVVPFRNGIMLSVAIGLAETRGLKHVMIANHAGDHTIYPDCRPSFIRSMSAAAAAGTFVRIDIVAPFTDITKGDIALIGKKSGIDYTKTWSCYKGGEKQSC